MVNQIVLDKKNNIMKRQFSLEKLRNIGLMAHIDAGKTTTTERILYYAGRVHRLGEVDDGTATMDWMEQEQERGITITSASTTCFWEDYCINIIDTPGHIDFTVEVERSLRILDGGVVVFCAVGGVEPQSETVWRQAEKYRVPRIAFINKMDRIGADFYDTIEQMQEKLACVCVPIQIPLGKESSFRGIIDLINMKARVYDENDPKGLKSKEEEIPTELIEESRHFHDSLIATLGEFDEIIMDKYVHNQQIHVNEIKQALRKSTIQNKITPVLCGSSLKNKGIQFLIDAICDYLPSPLDVPSMKGVNPVNEQKEERIASDEDKFCGLAFKIMSDPYVGKLTFIRVYSGILKSGSYVYNANKNVKERIGKIVQMHANKQQIREVIFTGDIAAAVGLAKTKTGDTICDETAPIILESIHFPKPVIFMAIEPFTKADQDKLSVALGKLQEEDPTFKVHYEKDTNQTIISGMGELHLEILVDRLLREFKVQAKVGKPQVAYKETITEKVSSTGKYIQQTGGRGQYGHCVITMEPGGANSGIEFVNKIRGGAIPKEFISSVKKGVESAAQSGPLVGYEVTDVKVILVDGSFHEVDSSELAFKMAGSIAFSEGLKKGKPVLLEPLMNLEVLMPEEYMGEIISDLNSKRTKIESMEPKANIRVIKGRVPLSEMFGYATNLRSLSQGRATYTMEFANYEMVPERIADKIIGKEEK